MPSALPRFAAVELFPPAPAPARRECEVSMSPLGSFLSPCANTAELHPRISQVIPKNHPDIRVLFICRFTSPAKISLVTSWFCRKVSRFPAGNKTWEVPSTKVEVRLRC